METRIAQNPPEAQATSSFARDAVLSWRARQIAELVAQMEANDPQVTLGDLEPRERDRLVADAAAFLRRRDPQTARTARYFAANTLIGVGLGSCTKDERVYLVRKLEVALSAYHQALGGLVPEPKLQQMALLAMADQGNAPEPKEGTVM